MTMRFGGEGDGIGGEIGMDGREGWIILSAAEERAKSFRRCRIYGSFAEEDSPFGRAVRESTVYGPRAA